MIFFAEMVVGLIVAVVVLVVLAIAVGCAMRKRKHDETSDDV